MEISSMNISELIELTQSLNIEKYRARQIFQWIHQKFAKNFSDMTNLPKQLRTALSENYSIGSAEIEKKYEAFEGDTSKYLLRLEKNTIIESVLMKYSFGNSVCVSSQAGCAMGCAFCRSGEDGLDRDLTAYEMLAQVYRISEDIGERISNVVIMGSGEPLHNFSNVIKFLEILNSEDGANIGKRHITLSSCGIVPKIYELADRSTGVNLAISLHAPNDEVRKTIMPVAKSYGLSELIKSCDYYGKVSGRRITYEYALISGVNDSRSQAHELGARLKGRLCHVNLIPVNEVSGKGFYRPKKNVIKEFADILSKEHGIETTIRRELGSSVNAACGQLKGCYRSTV